MGRDLDACFDVLDAQILVNDLTVLYLPFINQFKDCTFFRNSLLVLFSFFFIPLFINFFLVEI